MNASLSRRSLLAGIGATAVSTALPGRGISAADTGFIDVHHHHVPPALAAAAAAYAAKTGTPLAGPIKDWTPAKSLATMDANGVSTSVLVLAHSAGVWDFTDPASLRRMARACNEYGAEMARAHPGRYAFFAWLPMPDIAGCLAEIAYALDRLGAAGIGFYTSYGTRWAGDKAFTPIYDELHRRKAVAYYHPLAPACCNDLIPGVRDNYTEFPQDTARAVTSLLFNGQLATHRDIKWIFSHAGGPVPVYAGRIQALASLPTGSSANLHGSTSKPQMRTTSRTSTRHSISSKTRSSCSVRTTPTCRSIRTSNRSPRWNSRRSCGARSRARTRCA